jgi:hypothetical protein
LRRRPTLFGVWNFLKELDDHVAAIALYVAHYNLCRVHEALRATPAKAIGVADRLLLPLLCRLRPPPDSAAKINGHSGREGLTMPERNNPLQSAIEPVAPFDTLRA